MSITYEEAKAIRKEYEKILEQQIGSGYLNWTSTWGLSGLTPLKERKPGCVIGPDSGELANTESNWGMRLGLVKPLPPDFVPHKFYKGVPIFWIMEYDSKIVLGASYDDCEEVCTEVDIHLRSRYPQAIQSVGVKSLETVISQNGVLKEQYQGPTLSVSTDHKEFGLLVNLKAALPEDARVEESHKGVPIFINTKINKERVEAYSEV